ncbi:ArnT family glycosyltransferase [Patescibacteria group bacterium]
MKNITKKQKILLFIIVIVALVLRFYKLGQVPAGINRDEASIGYNAYSILKTGKEEHGNMLPVFIESFGDWKLPAYQYLSIPFIYIFGLSNFSVRFLSALVGSLSVFVIFLLGKNILSDKKRVSVNVGLFSALFLAINPWHLHISRIAFEANLACFLFLLGLVCFLKGIKKKPKFFLFGSLLWSVALFSYHAAYVFLPLMFLIIVFKAFKAKFKNKKPLYLGIIVFFTFVFLHLVQFINQADVKITGVGITSDPVIKHLKTELIRFDHLNPQSLGSRVFHNRFIVYPWLIAEKYLAVFSADFLYFNGSDNYHHNITGFGNFYVVNLLFCLIGLFFLLKNKHHNSLLILLWLILAPIPSAITKNSPHSLRAIFLLPVIILVTGVGGAQFLKLIKNKILKKLLLVIYFIALLLNIGLYLDNYYVHALKTDAKHWNYGMEELYQYLNSIQDKYKKVITTHPDYSDYIFYAFYSNYDPKKFLKEVVYYPRDEEGFRHVKQLGNYYFVENIDEYELENLYFDYADAVPANVKILKTINLPNNDPYLVVFEI